AIRDARSDDEIAAVIGHELGHVVLGHRKERAASEAEADYFALYLLARAGFDTDAAADAWRRRARTAPESLIEWGNHPSAPERALAAERALAEIAAKRAAGQPLVPEDNQ
ncbi:MAG TPA: M48 family metalloprotease, partial [Myxococcota bacterium]|nr:M48 family metalloprotease [Myxococcota bacterium]